MPINVQGKTPDFRHTGFNSPITEVAVMLVAQKDQEYSCLGSGIIVGPTIALTARHVVDGFADIYDGAPLEHLKGEGTFSLQAFQFLENGTKFRAWDVRQIYIAPDPRFTDIVFLRLQPTSQDHVNYNWIKVRMRLCPPSVGTTASAFGYHSTSIQLTGDGVEITTNPYTTTGVVEKIHNAGRDSAMLPFPCFRTNARFDRAMSGGPVFSQDGHLCGIICSNLPPDSEENHASYVAALWPSMGVIVGYDREGHRHGVSYPANRIGNGGISLCGGFGQSVSGSRSSHK